MDKDQIDKALKEAVKAVAKIDEFARKAEESGELDDFDIQRAFMEAVLGCQQIQFKGIMSGYKMMIDGPANMLPEELREDFVREMREGCKEAMFSITLVGTIGLKLFAQKFYGIDLDVKSHDKHEEDMSWIAKN